MKLSVRVFSSLVLLLMLNTINSSVSTADVTVVDKGISRSVIVASTRIMAPDATIANTATDAVRQTEENRRRLRESVNDLSRCLQVMSGASITVANTPLAQGSKQVPVLIGEMAVKQFGAVKLTNTYGQGWRFVVTPSAVALMGESDLATSYAIYELLDRLGCRWYVPGDMGEVIPQRKTVSLPLGDWNGTPGTLGRNIWYADADFKRRNRLNGNVIEANHALENYITPELLNKHPEWRAIVDGKPHEYRLKWSAPGVAEAVADAIIAQLDKSYTPSVSLSPQDGVSFDESDDKAWDAGDWDASMDQVSITDRYVKFCNKIAERVTKKYPDVLFGFLAYVQYTRPPLREKPHPNLVPEIAPITYCRAHDMTDTTCPSRPQMRPIVEGWGKAAPHVAYYNYMYNLAEVSAPYPMIRQMSTELPILYNNHVSFWQPETMPNFETVLPGMTLTIRKAWNPKANSDKILGEFYTNYYGSAAEPMRRYWETIDKAWIEVPAHAGCGFSYNRRFTPVVMQEARKSMDEALAATKTAMEYRRVKMHDDSFRQFERFMQLAWDLRDGHFDNMERNVTQWNGTQISLANEYTAQYAFSKASWARDTIAGLYFKSYFEKAYLDAGRIARDYATVTPPLLDWRYAADTEKKGEANGWQSEAFDSSQWKTTDIGTQTWADLSLISYMGTVWYRRNVDLPAIPAGKKVYLWVSRQDGLIKLFVNGKHIPYTDAQGKTAEGFNSFCEPVSFEVTDAIKPGAANQIAISGTRTFFNEIGTGGLLGPVLFYREK